MVKGVQAMFQNHEFLRSGIDIPKGRKDVPLFAEVADLGCDVFVCCDIRQLGADRLHERLACRDSGLHWIGIPKVVAKGRRAMTADASMFIGALLHIVDDLAVAEKPQCYVLNKGPRNLAESIDWSEPL